MLPPAPRQPRLPRQHVPDDDGDFNVQCTNDDATSSKLCCTQLGYLHDPFVQFFVRRPVRRPPLINRGYYARVAAIRQLLLRFLSAGSGPKQVLSLGAGFDSTYFQLAAASAAPQLYVELDFPEVTKQKAAIVARQPQLRDLVMRTSESAPTAADGAGGRSADGTAGSTAGSAPRGTPGAREPEVERCFEEGFGEGFVRGGGYRLYPADLRRSADVAAALESAGIDREVPTLILLECVLVYMEPEESRALLTWAAGAFTGGAAVLLYDPTRPDDAFGRQMVRNLSERGVPLRSLADAKDPDEHAARLRACGWQRAEALDMDSVYRSDHLLDPSERRRTERLELLDEVEEFRLLLRHYVLALGVSHPSAEPSAAPSATPPATCSATPSGAQQPATCAGDAPAALLRAAGGDEARGGGGAVAALSALRLVGGTSDVVRARGEGAAAAAAAAAAAEAHRRQQHVLEQGGSTSTTDR